MEIVLLSVGNTFVCRDPCLTVSLIVTREDLVPLSLSSLKYLDFLRFNLTESLFSGDPEKTLRWMDSTGIPMFLSFFPHNLPLTDGVQIDTILVQDLLHSGPIHVHDRSEVEDALLQF